MKTQLYLTPADNGRVLTLEEFTTARSQEGYYYEIIHGRLEVSPIPNLPHEGVRKWMERLLDRSAEVPSIQEYWIVDPRQGSSRTTLLVYRRSGQRWAHVRTVQAGGAYTTPLLPDFTLVATPQA